MSDPQESRELFKQQFWEPWSLKKGFARASINLLVAPRTPRVISASLSNICHSCARSKPFYCCGGYIIQRAGKLSIRHRAGAPTLFICDEIGMSS